MRLYNSIKKRLVSFISKLKQNNAIKENYINNQDNLIIFIVPNRDIINGGVMSICSIYNETLKLKNVHNSEVIVCTQFSRKITLCQYTKFDNNVFIYRLSRIIKHFQNVNNLLIHLPEYLTKNFLHKDIKMIDKWLNNINNVHINILNQNIKLMPSEQYLIEDLKIYCNKLTCTTAHEAYSNQSIRDKYNIPLHHLSTFVSPENYLMKRYKDKKNIIVISPDKNHYKIEIINKIKNALPQFKIIIINNFKYNEYKELISKAKFAITFGEGLDGYYVEPTFSGAISFAIYNKLFFTSDYKKLPTIYDSYEIMLNNICSDIKKYNNETIYNQIFRENFNYISQIYQIDIYREKLKNFYTNNYDWD